MKNKEYTYRLFYMEPPIKRDKIPQIQEFKSTDFDTAHSFAKEWIQRKKKEGTEIFMLAKVDWWK